MKYHLILGMNNGGGNYGPRLIYPFGQMELFSIIGCWTHDERGDPTYPQGQGYLSIDREFGAGPDPAKNKDLTALATERALVNRPL